MTPTFEIPPSGDRGKKTLPIEMFDYSLRSLGFVEGAQALFDWYNDHLQILIFDNQDDPALHIRFNQDGTIAEIVAREWFNLLPEGRARPQSAWEISRDGKGPAMILTQEHLDIMKHTRDRAAGGFYCGDSPAMRDLVAAGLMAYAGRKTYVPDPYFTLTEQGLALIKRREATERMLADNAAPSKLDLLHFAEAIAAALYDDPDNEPPKVASEDAHAQRNEWITQARLLLGKASQ